MKCTKLNWSVTQSLSHSVTQSVSQSVSQSLSQLGQSVNRVSKHLIRVTNMVNEKEL